MKRVTAFLPAIVFVGLALALGVSLTKDPKRLPSMLVDKAAPSFDLPPLMPDGSSFSSAALAGKVSLVNVFASWCQGCKLEHSTLMKLSREGKATLYGVNWKDKIGDGERWLDRLGNPYVLAGKDTTGRLAIDLGVTGVPETFVVDRTSRIRYRHAGPITEDVWRDVISPLLSSLGAEQKR